MIDGVLESSLSVTINYNLLCIRVCAFINQAWILFEDNVKALRFVRVEGSRNLLSRDDLQWVSRMCCLLCVGRWWIIIFLTVYKPLFSQKG